MKKLRLRQLRKSNEDIYKRQNKKKPGGNNEHRVHRTQDTRRFNFQNKWTNVSWEKKIVRGWGPTFETKKARIKSWTWGKKGATEGSSVVW